MPHDRTAGGPATALLGRTGDLDWLAAMVDRLRSGSGGVLLISGEPGIGKTALLTAVTARAAAAGARIAHGAAEEAEQRVPFAAISACLDLTPSSADRRVAGVAALLRGGDGHTVGPLR